MPEGHSTKKGHDNAEGMANFGVYVELTVRLRREDTMFHFTCQPAFTQFFMRMPELFFTQTLPVIINRISCGLSADFIGNFLRLQYAHWFG